MSEVPLYAWEEHRTTLQVGTASARVNPAHVPPGGLVGLALQVHSLKPGAPSRGENESLHATRTSSFRVQGYIAHKKLQPP